MNLPLTYGSVMGFGKPTRNYGKKKVLEVNQPKKHILFLQFSIYRNVSLPDMRWMTMIPCDLTTCTRGEVKRRLRQIDAIDGYTVSWLWPYLVVNYPRSSFLWVKWVSSPLFLWTTCPHKNPIEITGVN